MRLVYISASRMELNVPRLSIFLYGSTFLAFTAATLDLAQTLARGPREGDSDINLSTVWGVLYARELLFAFSFGLLNLFFWKLVACRPVEEISLSNVDSKPQSQQEHSANWHRWGLVGMFLKWASLAATLSIPLLQILWRLLPNQRQYGSIYIASTTIETVLAAVFALKLVLNVCISPQEWWFALRSCVVPMFALAVQIGLGIGNLTECKYFLSIFRVSTLLLTSAKLPLRKVRWADFCGELKFIS